MIRAISVLFLLPLGLFAQARTFRVQEWKVAGTVRSSVPVDCNGDGWVDVAVLASDLSCFLNRAGTFDQTPVVSPGAGAGAALQGTADFNLDGKADLFSETTLFLGQGDGRFQRVNPDWGPKVYATGDFNEDGIPDLAGEWVLLGRGDGTFQASPLPGPAAGAMDCNGDGHLDLIVRGPNSYQGMGISLGNGKGQFTAGKTIVGAQWLTAVGDLNGDGLCDVMGSTWTFPAEFPHMLTTYLGDRDGGLTVSGRWQTDSDYYYTGMFVDLDRDGNLDLVGDTGYGTIMTRGHGDGKFYETLSVAGTWTIDPIRSADFDRDNRPDLVVLTYPNVISILTQQGSESTAVATSAANDAAVASPGGLASLKAANLAAGSVVGTAADGKWPEHLGGVELHLVDGVGRNLAMGLLYVSAGQINFQIPAGVADGWKTLELQDASGVRQVGKVLVQRGAPGIFQSGGAPIVEAGRINADGTVTPIPAVSIPLSGPVQVSFYLTGFEGTVADTWAVVGGKRVAPASVGSVPGVPGLQRVTIRIDQGPVAVSDVLLFSRGNQIR